jgi:hypothetical protein
VAMSVIAPPLLKLVPDGTHDVVCITGKCCFPAIYVCGVAGLRNPGAALRRKQPPVQPTN